jgi:hypothetical protein
LTQKSFQKLQKEFERTAHRLKLSKDTRERRRLLRKFRLLIEESDQILLDSLPIASHPRFIEQHNEG